MSKSKRKPKITHHSKMDLSNKPILGSGIYTPPDISLILKIPQHRIRWYISAVWDNRFGQKLFGERYSWNIDNQKAVNFLVLIEFFVVAQLHELGLSTRRILKAREAIAKDIKQPYPFAKSTLLADANQIWYKIRDQVINADTTHQLNFAQCVENYCRLIDFTNETASQLWPDGRNSCIIVNPHHQFGQPVIDGTNTTAETMFLMFKSGDSIEALSKLYKLPTQKISDAIHFYQQRTAA